MDVESIRGAFLRRKAVELYFNRAGEESGAISKFDELAVGAFARISVKHPNKVYTVVRIVSATRRPSDPSQKESASIILHMQIPSSFGLIGPFDLSVLSNDMCTAEELHRWSQDVFGEFGIPSAAELATIADRLKPITNLVRS